METTWIVEDTDKIGDLTDLHNAIENSGAQLIKTKMNWGNLNKGMLEEIEIKNRPVLAYGTINFINVLRQVPYKIFPLFYADKHKYDVTRYTHILGERYLNYNYSIYPIRDIAVRDTPEKPIFIRPIGGYKAFAGYVIKPEEYKREMRSLVSCTMGYEDPLVLIGQEIKINSEYRFVVANNIVVSGSMYLPEEEPIPDDHPSYNYAQEVAVVLSKNEIFWQPEKAYTLDIAEIDSGFKVVEVNSFSCAGLYCCDKNKVVKALNDVMKKDYLEEMGNRFIDWKDSLMEEK